MTSPTPIITPPPTKPKIAPVRQPLRDKPKPKK